MMGALDSKIKRVLIIQTAFLGDIVLTTAFLRELKKYFSGRHEQVVIDLVTTSVGAEALKNLPGIFTHVFEKRKMGFFEGIKKVLRSLDSRKQVFDYVFCVHRSFRSLYLGRKVKAKRRIAFSSSISRALGYEQVQYARVDSEAHYLDKVLKMMSVLPAGSNHVSVRTPWLISDQVSNELADEFFYLSSTKYFLLNPFSAWGTKQWFSDRFVFLAIELIKKYEAPIVIIGEGVGLENEIAKTMCEKISLGLSQLNLSQVKSSDLKIFNLVGKTSISSLINLVKNARLLVSGDSAPVHIAAAFDVPTVAIFGPTVIEFGFYPLSSRNRVIENRSIKCRPCSPHGPMKCPKKHFKCMDEISVLQVFNAVEALIGQEENIHGT